MALAVVLCGRYMTGDDEEDEPIIILDPAAETLTPLARDMFAVRSPPLRLVPALLSSTWTAES